MFSHIHLWLVEASDKAVVCYRLYLMVFINVCVNLRRVRVGCHAKSLFIGCLLYADDIIMEPSVSGLQNMLNCCSTTSKSLKLMFNCNMSCCIRFRPAYKRSIDYLIVCNHALS